MRKAWSRSPGGQPEQSREYPSQDHSTRAESWRAHERWRSPHDTNVESPISVSGAVEGGSGSDKGGGRKQGSVSVNGDGEDGADGQETEFDTETEADGLDGKSTLCWTAFWLFFTLFSVDTRQMPPPPMPASLDPTTVSSLAHAHAARSSSPRGSIQWDKNGVSATWIPPQNYALTSASSGRSSQPPSQGTSTVTPAPSNSTIVRSPVPLQVNYGTLSPSTSFPLAMQAQGSTHPPPLAASVSPSATFSKLSLHSPDVSSSLHLSVPCSPEESAPLSPASSMQHTSDHQSSSPPHRPSKPLHVHPQNESPSLSPSLAAPGATLNSPDGTRDTPAEAQYQQPYRSSPESSDEAYPPADVEKKCPTNGEAYRVRFASPEILCGMPRLRGRVTSDGPEPVDAYDGVSANDAIAVVKEHEAPLDRDAMDVEADVIGDTQGDGPSQATSPESDMNDVLDEVYSSAHAPGSPRPPAPSDSQPYGIPLVEDDGAAPENDSSPPPSDVNETTSQAESMVVDAGPAQPARGPSPPPPPKVKMSLKDFALRKKKQREEEMAAKALYSPATPDRPGLPPSPGVDVKQDLISEHAGIMKAADSGAAINGQDVKMNYATEGALDSSGTAYVNANGFDGCSGHGYDAVRGSGLGEERATAEDNDNRLSAETVTQAPSMVVATKAPDTPQSSSLPARSSTVSSSRVLGERNNSDHTQMQIAATLTAKMEIIDAMIPSGLVGVDGPMPDVVSFAPEPPPPPLTTKQTSETTTIDRIVSVGTILKSVPPLIAASTSTPTSMSTSTSTSTVNSRSNSVGIPGSIPNSNSLPHAHAPLSLSSIPPSRRPSHEDGEITSSTPPKHYLPRSHTPPTQPRSFNAVHPSPPSFGPTSSSTASVPRRPAPPLSRSPLSGNAGPSPTPISSRPLPSGPRALRGSMTQPTHPYAPTRPPYTGSQYIPRGPSADRDRIDWERGDRQWAAQARPRGRAGSNGWGR